MKSLRRADTPRREEPEWRSAGVPGPWYMILGEIMFWVVMFFLP